MKKPAVAGFFRNTGGKGEILPQPNGTRMCTGFQRPPVYGRHTHLYTPSEPEIAKEQSKNALVQLDMHDCIGVRSRLGRPSNANEPLVPRGRLLPHQRSSGPVKRLITTYEIM